MRERPVAFEQPGNPLVTRMSDQPAFPGEGFGNHLFTLFPAQAGQGYDNPSQKW